MPPPADLVVVSKVRREYTATDERRQGKMGSVYSFMKKYNNLKNNKSFSKNYDSPALAFFSTA